MFSVRQEVNLCVRFMTVLISNSKTLFDSVASPLISGLSSSHCKIRDGQSSCATRFSVLNDLKLCKLSLTVITPPPFSLCELIARTANG